MGGVALVALAAGVVGGWYGVVRPRLVTWAETALSQAFDAEVSVGEVGVDAFSAFPRVAVTVSSLRVDGRAPFDGVRLLDAGPSSVEVDLASLLGDTVRIEGLSVDRATLSVLVLKDGRSNLDTFLGGSSEGGSGTGVSLSDVRLQQVALRYDDRASDLRVEVDDFGALVSGVISTTTRFDVTARAGRVAVVAGGTRYLDDAVLDAVIALDQAADGTLTFGENRVAVNQFPLAFDGTVRFGASDTAFDLKFSSPENAITGLVSLLPGTTAANLQAAETSGTVSFSGRAAGRWPGDGTALPALDVDLKLADASFRFPGQPVGLDRLALDLLVHHPEGPARATELDARSFEVVVADQALRGRFSLRDPLGDPLVDASVHGRVDLGRLRSAWPSVAESTPPAGELDLDLDLAGRLSEFSSSKADAVTCRGSVGGRRVRYVSEGWPDLLVERFALELTPTSWSVGETVVSWAGAGPPSDTTWTGRLEQVLPWVIRGDTLRGALSLQSRSLDLRPFQGDAEDPDAAAGAIAAVPTWLDLELGGAIDHLVTEVFVMDDVRGALVVRDGAVRMQDLGANMLGGRVTLDGQYAAPDVSAADIDLAISGIELDLADTFSTFATMERIVPVLKGVSTHYDTGMTLKARLGPDGTPELEALASEGTVLPDPARLQPAVMAGLADALKARDAQELRVGGSRIGWRIERGRMTLTPSKIELGGREAELSGSAGVVDRTLDLRIATTVPAGLVKPKALAGLPDASGPLDLALTVRGTFSDPRLGVALGGATLEAIQDAVGQAVDDLIGEAERQGDALVAEAERQKDALVAEARAQAKKLHQEAQKQSQKLVDEAGTNPIAKQGATQAGKELVRKADQAGDELVAQATKLGDKGIAEARARKADLVEAARKKSRAR